METNTIAYLWVENYQNVLVNIGFNFGSECVFKIEQKTKKVLSLLVESDESFIPDFFKLDDTFNGIQNVTAVIGKNGSGKSLFCKLLREILTGSYPNTNYVLIFRTENNKSNVSFSILNRSDFSLNKINKSDFNLDEIKREFSRFDSGIEFPPPNIKDTEVVYYTPIVDLSSTEFLTNSIGGIDLSTDNLVYQDLERLLKSKIEYGVKDYFILSRSEDFRRQYQFIHEFQYFNLPKDGIKIHTEEVFINFHNYNYNPSKIFNSDDGWNIPSDIKTLIEVIANKFITEQNSLFEQRKKFKDNSLKTDRLKINELNQNLYLIKFTYNVFRFYLYNLNRDNGYLNYKIIENSNEENVEHLDFIGAVKYFISNQKLVDKVYLLDLIETIERVKEKLQFEDHYSSCETISLGGEDLLELYVNNLNCLSEFKGIGIGGYRKEAVNFLTFEWAINLSTGERAFINLFSRLFYSRKVISERASDESWQKKRWPEFLVIILDEAELGFHPQWQKEYLSSLINNIPWIFANKKGRGNNIVFTNIQIIVTSHSPFLLSDMPDSNVVLLDRLASGESKVTNRQAENIKQSFGANIHQLFYNRYFLQNGFIGDFASAKIETVIKRLNTKTVSRLDKNELWSIIQLIGEPFIKNELKDLYFRKFPDDYRKQQEINELEQRLNQLKNVSN